MARYALWNNKGGVGKSFLTFSLACEYAIAHPDEFVLALDLCPQANLTEMLYGDRPDAGQIIDSLYARQPRLSVGGYLEARLNSPFVPINDIRPFVTRPSDSNSRLPTNLYLVPGDNLLELLSEAIRQASQLLLPMDAWSKVMRWLQDLVRSFEDLAGGKQVTTFIDCNPSFSIYTQIALCACENLIVPFTADDSSRRGIENIFALLYGVADNELKGYARLSFTAKAVEGMVELPRIHTLVNNRVTIYKSEPSSAFQAKTRPIREVVEEALNASRKIFVSHTDVAHLFEQMPDYHSVAVVASSEGCPLSRLQSGHHTIDGKVVQVNQTAINKYQKAIAKLVQRI